MKNKIDPMLVENLRISLADIKLSLDRAVANADLEEIDKISSKIFALYVFVIDLENIGRIKPSQKMVK